MTLMTKTEMRKQLRLKPAPGQQPEKREWRAWQWADLYDSDKAVPLRPYRPATPAQAAALERGRIAREEKLERIAIRKFTREQRRQWR